jgi:hypothetical protein
LVRDVTEEGFIKHSGEVMDQEAMAYHLSSILSGIYSLGGQEDKVILEGLIYPDSVFAPITYRGVPDIRLIVYRGVPVMAMVPLPTKQPSKAKPAQRPSAPAWTSTGASY